jgi:hypothetical protein
MAWLVVIELQSGAINVVTTGDATNAGAGNTTSSVTGVLMAFILFFSFLGKFESTEAHIQRANKTNGISTSNTETPAPTNDPEVGAVANSQGQKEMDEKVNIEKAPLNSPKPETLSED